MNHIGKNPGHYRILRLWIAIFGYIEKTYTRKDSFSIIFVRIILISIEFSARKLIETNIEKKFLQEQKSGYLIISLFIFSS